jgi:predicted RNase H-like HicB family nuclease
MEYVYPAIFEPNDDGSFTITFPDLPGCISEGKSLANAVYMAGSGLTQWIEYHNDNKINLPKASDFKDVEVNAPAFVNVVRAEVKENRAVKRTISLPKWLDDKAVESGLSLSRVLQDALTQRLQ